MNLEDMKGAVLLLALIALIGAASALALDGFKDNVLKDMPSTAVVNESETTLTNSSSADCSWVDTDGTYTAEVNASGTGDRAVNITTLTSSNFTIATGGAITVNVANISGNRSWLHYFCYGPNHQYNITLSGLEGVDNSTSYLDTIGTIIGVAVLIGIVVLAFTFVRR